MVVTVAVTLATPILTRLPPWALVYAYEHVVTCAGRPPPPGHLAQDTEEMALVSLSQRDLQVSREGKNQKASTLGRQGFGL